MRQSQLFTKTQKEAPADEVAKNAKLLIRAGFVDKLQAGVYTYLPLGLRVLKNIENIIREEMNSVGGQEILMPSLQPKENWQTTGRWDTMDDLYKVIDISGRENALGPTHEEIVVPLVKQFISSYRDLPFATYQFQNKFRMELRAKSGILRGREFIMKDMYSFHRNETDMIAYYEKMKGVYANVFERVGIGATTFLTFASGGSFSKYSHEFQTITSAGEDTIYICDKCRVAVNNEIIEDQKHACPECGGKNLRAETSVEVGNIFELKTRFSAPFNLSYKDEDGKDQSVVMGCYGIGLGRVLGTVVEVLGDEKGLVWPDAISPFGVHIVELGGSGDDIVRKESQKLYDELISKGIEVLWDDRDLRAGEKFAESDLIGIPLRVVVSSKTIASESFEIKNRATGEVSLVGKDELMAMCKAK
ncbi:MAG: Proline-tRNA ligase [Parcubacteria group bacterium GW2011_GWC1_42_11]|uniref:Proline--tRNA ligase n=1 Tax=Candidatus Nomurabacteria bacterium GW2011_GWC2_42_20 TaxID=1618756 RepID=A0A0G0ZFW8_9BACT|nr:MAG: Proline-tRNA ligase [Parcubacteria group bacterium GW2011_GWC1_42_11]KKS47620.1 MAG: Proline-tRNA ligase [Candidatus Nomurabacteria bacterium GW2011_GWC2_42_20]KKT08955.1 MAG: Proline-tRNA ligase [Candidatus Nomurabacteria bacterium GW2011_GWB1_43_20]TAN36853.1 MAG: prolyl-tRNA synthetase [Patescibacteria group bacterium]HBH71470.1 prolyl-tRNA synthetase [Candidatus Yonathbacteria bacterium]